MKNEVPIDQDQGNRAYSIPMPYDQRNIKFGIDMLMASFKGQNPPAIYLCKSHSVFIKYDTGVHAFFDQDKQVHGKGKASGRDCEITLCTAREAAMLFSNPKLQEMVARLGNLAYHSLVDLDISELKRPTARNSNTNLNLMEARKPRERARERQRNYITE